MFIGSEERGGIKERELLLGAQIVDHQLCSVNRPDASAQFAGVACLQC